MVEGVMDVRLIRCFIVFVIVSFIIGVGSAFNGSTVNVDNEKKENVSTKSVDKKENEIVKYTETVENEKNALVTEKETVNNQKQIEKASEVKTSVDKDEVKNNPSQSNENRGDDKKQQLNVQEKVDQTQKVEQSNNVEQIVVVEEKKEEVKIDNEYETLLKQVEYSSYDECMEIGFEKAIKDSVGILGFSCPYIAYNGKIIGYRLQLDYTNPMNN